MAMHSLGNIYHLCKFEVIPSDRKEGLFFYMVLWLAYVTMVYTGIYWTPRLVSHVPYYKAIRLGKRKDSDIPIFVIKAFPTTLQIGITSIPLSLFYYWTRVIYEFGNNHAWLILLIEYTIPYTKKYPSFCLISHTHFLYSSLFSHPSLPRLVFGYHFFIVLLFNL